VPVPRARKQAARQLELVTEWTLDRIRENREINEIRAKVQLWRRRGYPDVTPTTRALLDYWADPGRDNPILFCQREAAETTIYIAEAAPKSGDVWIRNELDTANAEHTNGLPRLAVKMATGSGKTVVMAMLIAWQTLNKVASPQDARFAKHFLVVTLPSPALARCPAATRSWPVHCPAGSAGYCLPHPGVFRYSVSGAAENATSQAAW
jgi:type III restriction enzyme